MIKCGDVKEFAGVGMLSLAVTFGVGQGTRSMYSPMIQYIEAYNKEMRSTQLALEKMAEAASSVQDGSLFPGALAASVKTISSGTNIPSRLMNDALRLATVSRDVACHSAIFVCPLVTVMSYMESRDRKEKVPLVVDVMQGAAIGSLFGLGVGACSSNVGSLGLRLATGAISGFISGGISSFIGSASASLMNRLSAKRSEGQSP